MQATRLASSTVVVPRPVDAAQRAGATPPSPADASNLPELRASIAAAAVPHPSAEASAKGLEAMDAMIQMACGRDDAALQAQDALLKVYADDKCAPIRSDLCKSALAMSTLAFHPRKDGELSGHSLSVPVAHLAYLAEAPPNGDGPRNELRNFIHREAPGALATDAELLVSDRPVANASFDAACSKFGTVKVHAKPLMTNTPELHAKYEIERWRQIALQTGGKAFRVQSPSGAVSVTVLAVVSGMGDGRVQWQVINTSAGVKESDDAAQWILGKLHENEYASGLPELHEARDGGDALAFAILQKWDDEIMAVINDPRPTKPSGTFGERCAAKVNAWAAMSPEDQDAVRQAAHAGMLGAAAGAGAGAGAVHDSPGAAPPLPMRPVAKTAIVAQVVAQSARTLPPAAPGSYEHLQGVASSAGFRMNPDAKTSSPSSQLASAMKNHLIASGTPDNKGKVANKADREKLANAMPAQLATISAPARQIVTELMRVNTLRAQLANSKVLGYKNLIDPTRLPIEIDVRVANVLRLAEGASRGDASAVAQFEGALGELKTYIEAQSTQLSTSINDLQKLMASDKVPESVRADAAKMCEALQRVRVEMERPDGFVQPLLGFALASVGYAKQAAGVLHPTSASDQLRARFDREDFRLVDGKFHSRHHDIALAFNNYVDPSEKMDPAERGERQYKFDQAMGQLTPQDRQVALDGINVTKELVALQVSPLMQNVPGGPFMAASTALSAVGRSNTFGVFYSRRALILKDCHENATKGKATLFIAALNELEEKHFGRLNEVRTAIAELEKVAKAEEQARPMLWQRKSAIHKEALALIETLKKFETAIVGEHGAGYVEFIKQAKESPELAMERFASIR